MPQRTDTGALIRQLDLIVEKSRGLEAQFSAELAQVHPNFQASARNLVAYLAMRQTDIRDLQQQLAYLGLSSLGRAERNVQASIRTVHNALCKLSDIEDCDPDEQRSNFERSERRLQQHIVDMLGENADGRDVRIMVTLPAEAADDYSLASALMSAGMDIARINCAHDDESVWLRMVQNIRQASQDTGRNCRIVMDLAGPKLRTGDLTPGPGVVRFRPKCNSMGKVIAPRRVRFIPDDTPSARRALTSIPVPRACIESAEVGDRFTFMDARGKARALFVVRKNAHRLRLECYRSVYLATGTRLELHHEATDTVSKYRVGLLPPTEEPIILGQGDTLILHRKQIPGEPAVKDADGTIVEPAHIACRQPEVFRFISVGDPVRLNDGKIEGIVRTVDGESLHIEITRAKANGSRLRGDKGINFPGSDIRFDGLTETDKIHLTFVASHADAVSLSFVRQPEDILALQEELKKSRSRQIGIVVKVETLTAFKNLPRLLLATMCHYPAGVMIARGDLAVECGWERLAEIQEEILWMCEAAQMPVIWATQVLEQETKKGQPSRAEITDAAMSQRADCVMLNKGPHILAAIGMLDDILRRMQAHQRKKTPTLRKLSISEV